MVDTSTYRQVKPANLFPIKGVLKRKESSSSIASDFSASSKANISYFKVKNEELEALGIEEGEDSEESFNAE